MRNTAFLMIWFGLAAAHAATPNSDPVAPASVGEVKLIVVPQFAEADIQINLDGILDEKVWAEVPGYDGMTVIDPDTMTVPSYRTDAHYFSTEKGLYVGVKLEQPPDTLIARMSSRDSFLNRDAFSLTIDTSGKGLYGYWFQVNLGDSITDGKVAPERRFSNEWDGPWRRATTEFADGWGAEFFLPWSMMAMPKVEGTREFGFWANRKVAFLDERWATPALPFTSARFMSALGKMQLQDVQSARQLTLFPYASYTYDDIAKEDEYRAGLDVFWRPSTNLQLTATLNPDFGAVESDDVVVNLTAFETFFPEKRLFFVEGNEVFITTPRSRPGFGGSSGGARRTNTSFNRTPTTLLNTRRIGGAPRLDLPDGVELTGVETSRPTELTGAAKITGQQGSWRYGVLAAFEEDVRRHAELDGQSIRIEQDGRDYGVARLLYETGGKGRRSIGYLGTIVRRPFDDAVVHGVDTHLLSRDGKFNWDTQLVTSDVDQHNGYGAYMDLRYVPNREWRHSLQLDYSDDKLDVSDLGFIRRNDTLGGVYSVNYSTTQGLKRLRNKSRHLRVSYEQNGKGRMVRNGLSLRNSWTFKNYSQLRTELSYFPARWDDRNSFDNGSFRTHGRLVTQVGFGTATSKKLSVSGLVGARQEDLGGWTARVAGGVTFKPNDRFSFDLDATYFRRHGWLVYQEERDFTTFKATDWQPRLAMDFFISARQQVRLTMQWAGIRADQQKFWRVPEGDGSLDRVNKPADEETDDFTISRLTAQLRYRWEIGPLSDLFVVYTRGSNLDNQVDDEFSDLFYDALQTPVVNVLIMKVRYRFGS
jgi:hypothetical protein